MLRNKAILADSDHQTAQEASVVSDASLTLAPIGGTSHPSLDRTHLQSALSSITNLTCTKGYNFLQRLQGPASQSFAPNPCLMSREPTKIYFGGTRVSIAQSQLHHPTNNHRPAPLLTHSITHSATNNTARVSPDESNSKGAVRAKAALN
uniref:Uncharacterized protein n=1 Tax=Bionectria ochroleuca TaxID=29856 RepID=A0A8H7NM19_BIOOC